LLPLLLLSYAITRFRRRRAMASVLLDQSAEPTSVRTAGMLAASGEAQRTASGQYQTYAGTVAG
jgi:hypothetical protein